MDIVVKIFSSISIIAIVGVLIYTITRSYESPKPFATALINVFLVLGQIAALLEIWNK